MMELSNTISKGIDIMTSFSMRHVGANAVTEHLPPNSGEIIFSCYRGSVAHRTFVSGYSDDTDLLACYIGPPDVYIGIRDMANYGAYSYIDEHIDIIYYEMKKFLRLLLNCNPNVIAYLWDEEDDLLYLSDFAVDLINNRDAFISIKLRDTFMGYSFNQYDKMFKTTGNVGEKRKQLIAKVGYDPKFAHHAIRLMRMYLEFVDTGRFQVARLFDNQELIDIKLGNWTKDEVIAEYTRLDDLAKNKITFLPLKPNEDIVNEICRQQIYRTLRKTELATSVVLRPKADLQNHIYAF